MTGVAEIKAGLEKVFIDSSLPMYMNGRETPLP